MAYFMTDAAAGSQAALQLQKNMAASQYVGQDAAAAAEETQLKLEEDRLKAKYAPEEYERKAAEARLKAQYAPEEMQLRMAAEKAKLEQEQANTQKTILGNIVTNTGLQLDEQTNAITQDFYKDPANKGLNDVEASAKLAALMMPVNSDKAEKLMKYSSDADYKRSLADAKKADSAFKEIGSALSSVAGSTPEQFEQTIQRWTPEMKANIEKQIPGFMDEKDPKRQKAQLEALLYNHSGPTLQLKIQAEAALHEADRKSREHIAEVHAAGVAKGKESAQDKADLKANTMYTTAKGEIDRKYQKQEDKATEALDAAQIEVAKYGKEVTLLGRNPTEKAVAANAALAAASSRLAEIDKKRNRELLDLAARLPKGDTRDTILETLKAVSQPEESEKPDPKVDKPVDKPGATATGTVGAAPAGTAAPAVAASTKDQTAAKSPKPGYTTMIPGYYMSTNKTTQDYIDKYGLSDKAIENAKKWTEENPGKQIFVKYDAEKKTWDYDIEDKPTAKKSATSNKAAPKLSAVESNALIKKANEAIQQGADRAEVLKRLEAAGVKVQE